MSAAALQLYSLVMQTLYGPALHKQKHKIWTVSNINKEAHSGSLFQKVPALYKSRNLFQVQIFMQRVKTASSENLQYKISKYIEQKIALE